MFVNVKIYVETLVYRLSTMLFRGSVNNDLGVSHCQPHCEDILTVREEALNYNLLQGYNLNITSNGLYNIRKNYSAKQSRKTL